MARVFWYALGRISLGLPGMIVGVEALEQCPEKVAHCPKSPQRYLVALVRLEVDCPFAVQHLRPRLLAICDGRFDVGSPQTSLLCCLRQRVSILAPDSFMQ